MLSPEGLMKFFGVRTFTTVYLKHLNERDVELGRGGKGKMKHGVLEIDDNKSQGLRVKDIYGIWGQWVNVVDNTNARPPHATFLDALRNKIFPRGININEKRTIPDLGNAVAVYHGPGNSRRYDVR